MPGRFGRMEDIFLYLEPFILSDTSFLVNLSIYNLLMSLFWLRVEPFQHFFFHSIFYFYCFPSCFMLLVTKWFGRMKGIVHCFIR